MPRSDSIEKEKGKEHSGARKSNFIEEIDGAIN